MEPRVTKAQPSLPALSILRACGVQTEKTGVWVTVPSWLPWHSVYGLFPMEKGPRAGLSAPLQVGQGGFPEAGPAFLDLANRGHSTPGLQLSHLVRNATSPVLTQQRLFCGEGISPPKHISTSPLALPVGQYFCKGP